MKPEPSSIPRKPVHHFLAEALILFLLLGWFPTLKGVYPSLFELQGNRVFQSFGANRALRFERLASDTKRHDMRMLGLDKRRPREPRFEARFDSTRVGYWPIAGLVALILATPMTRSRRVASLLGGLALLDLVTLGRVAIVGQSLFVQARATRLGQELPAWGAALRVLTESVDATVPSFAFVLVIWVFVASPLRTLDVSPVESLLRPGGRKAG